METLATVKNDQHIVTVQNAFSDFLKGNISGILDSCTEDITWGSFDNPALPFTQTYHGKKGVAEFFATIAGTIDYTAFQPRDYFAAAEKVFVKGYHRATVKSTGKAFGHEFLMEFTLRDGKLSSFFAWVDTREQAAAFTI